MYRISKGVLVASSVSCLALPPPLAMAGCSGAGSGDNLATAAAQDLRASNAGSYRVVPPPVTTKWAVVLCRASDETFSNDDVTFYKQLFTSSGSGGLYDFWNSQSKGATQYSADVLGPFVAVGNVFGIPLSQSLNSSQIKAVRAGQGRGALIDTCVNGARNGGVDFSGYYNIVTIFAGQPYTNYDLGSEFNGGRAVGDAFSAPNQLSHEMGHGFSLDHSYSDDSTTCGNAAPGEYGDDYDTMSIICGTHNFNSGLHIPGNGADNAGPGLNMWNRWKLGWASNAKFMFWPQSADGIFLTTTFGIGPRDSSAGTVYFVPVSNDAMYTVEYINPQGSPPDGWDRGVPQPVVVIHKIFYGDDHSYLVRSLPNAVQSGPGTPFIDNDTGVTIQVTSLANPSSATVTVSIDTSVSQTWVGAAAGVGVAGGTSSDIRSQWTPGIAPLGETNGSDGVGPFAFPAGSETGRTLYACHTYFHGVQIGKIWAGGPGCMFAWGGSERTGTVYEVLTQINVNLTWQDASNGQVLPGALIGGYEGGSPLYLCRAQINGGFAPGKMVGGACDVSFGGSENFFGTYQQLAP
jgi:hypothetical protein